MCAREERRRRKRRGWWRCWEGKGWGGGFLLALEETPARGKLVMGWGRQRRRGEEPRGKFQLRKTTHA